MSSLVRLVRSHPLYTFAVLACFFGWFPYLLAALGIGSHPENMPLGPAIAALVVTSCQGREALFAWGRTLRRWSGSPWLYLVAVVVPIALHLLIVFVNHGLGAPLPSASQLSAWPEIPVTFVVMLIAVGLGEEAGWTAFAAPVLLRRYGLFGAWLALSSMRILWHLPLMISGDMPVIVGLLGNAGFQLIVLQIMRRPHGVWSHAAVWHATLNAFGGAFFFTMVTGTDRDRLGMLLGVVYALGALLTLVPALVRRVSGGGSGTRRPAVASPIQTGAGSEQDRVDGRQVHGVPSE